MAVSRFKTSSIRQGTPKYVNFAGSALQLPATPAIGTASDVGTGRAFNNAAASVTFTPVGTLGTSYTVTSSPGGVTAKGSASPVAVTGLSSNTSYQFTVYSENATGASGYSSLSNSVTVTSVPQAPTIGTATAGNAQATVSFTPNATGGKAVTSYTVTSSPGGLTGTGSASPITVTGLTNGTAYTFTVTATNANGTSAASAASNSVTPVIPYPTVSGGTLTSDATYYYRTFKSNGTLSVSGGNVTADVLVIAGGGGGGAAIHGGGGGGAGGVQYFASQSLSGSLACTVGGGGSIDANGTNSTFGAFSASIGGGRGAHFQTGGAGTGGSGGGGSGYSTTSGAAGTAGQGTAGGNGITTPYGAGGGGGGASVAGSAATSTAPYAGKGGNGTNAHSAIATATSTGVSGYYAGGGGGGSPLAGGYATGGLGGGGYGGSYDTWPGAAGTANTGGGGGGATSTHGAGAGGSGIIIVRYTRAQVGG